MKDLPLRTDLRHVAVLVILGLLIGREGRAQAPVAVAIDPSQACPRPISERFSGLSYEVLEMAHQYTLNGQTIYRLSEQNAPLVAIHRSLGIRNLRIGGSSADKAHYSPTLRCSSTSETVVYSDDIDRLFALARAGGANVTLTLPLKPPTANPHNDALEAQYVWSKHSRSLLCFAIGNEPDLYPGETYSSYIASFDIFKEATRAAAPGARYCGPCVGEDSSWCVSFAAARAASLITHHNYPGGSAMNINDPATARYELLSINNEGFYNSWVPAVFADGLPCRIEETNSFSDGGKNLVSNTLAAALWGLDYMHWFAARGLAGLNFHTQDFSTGYSAIANSGSIYTVEPLGYGIKAFDLGGHGRPVPVTLANPLDLNLTAYGVLGADNRLCVTIVNKTTATNSLDAAVTINVAGRYDAGSVLYLSGPNDDLAALSGLTLGGSTISGNGAWSGAATPLVSTAMGQFTVSVPAAQAAIVTLTPRPPSRSRPDGSAVGLWDQGVRRRRSRSIGARQPERRDVSHPDRPERAGHGQSTVRQGGQPDGGRESPRLGPDDHHGRAATTQDQ